MYGIDTEFAHLKACWCLLFLLITGCASAEEFVSTVIAVIDGDTVLVRRANGVLKIRLLNIDAPEVGHEPNSQQDQPFGLRSKQSLSDLVLGKPTTIVSQAMDQYGRMLANLSVNGLGVNAEQIRRGMAWEYSHYHSNQALIALQAEAKLAGRGLWADDNPVPPWDWRKQHAHSFDTGNLAPVDSSCAAKKYCAEMDSCAEARHYLTVCGRKYLDGDGDGTPCEKLCNPSPDSTKNNRSH
jgi:endonuclease YncB( thermonuclease family)